MKKYILVVLLLIAFVGCQDTNNQAVKDIKEKTPDMKIEESETISEIEEEDSLEDEQIIGKWISHVKDSFGGESISLYMFDDGTLLTNDFKLAGLENKEYSSYLSGTWKNNGDSILFSIDKQMILDFESGIVEEKIDKVLVTLDILDISDQLLVINEQTYEKSGGLIGVGSNDFNGNWSRTEVHKAHGGYLNILEVNSNYMIFSAELYYGGNTGIALGIAVFDFENEAEYIHMDKSYDSQEVVDIRFKLVDDSIFVESNHNPALGFGMNVYIDGEYIKGEPEYTNKNVLIDTFYSQDRIDIMKDFLGEESWRFLFHVID